MHIKPVALFVHQIGKDLKADNCMLMRMWENANENKLPRSAHQIGKQVERPSDNIWWGMSKLLPFE